MFRALVGRLLLIAVTILMPLVASVTQALPAAADVKCADLKVTSIVVDPSSPIIGQDATVKVTVTNQGSCPAAGFVTQWQYSPNTQAALSETLSGLSNGDSHEFDWTFAFPKDGNFLTTATVDSGNAIDETIEVNNTAILSVTVQPKTIDLQPTSIVFIPNPAVATDAMTAKVHVVNVGNTDASDFQVQWNPTPNGPPQTQIVSGLAAFGGNTDVTFTYTYPNQGTFNTTATVDSLKDIKETNEQNNTITQSLTVDPPLPDLVVDNVVVSPANPVAGQVMTTTVTVKNVGHRPAGDFEVDWTPVFGQKLQQQVVGPLNDGDSVDVVFSYTYDRGGSFTGQISVDSTNKVREVNEKNNTDALQVTVGDAAIDLTITDFEASPNPPVQGADTTFTVKVKNQGNTAAGPFVVAVNPDSSNVSSRGDQSVSAQVDSLDPGQEKIVTLHFQYPDPGNFRAIAQVDVLKSVAESNEANNTALLNLVVKPGDVNLIVSSFVITTDLCSQAVGYADPCGSNLYWAGTAMTAHIEVTNTRTFPAGPFSVEWLRQDTDTRGPTASVDGLLPGQSISVDIHSTYSKDGTFNTFAVVDPFDQVKEGCAGCEADNISSPDSPSNPITVMQRLTNVNVGFPHFYVHNDLDCCFSNWHMYFMVLDSYTPNVKCSVTWDIVIKDITVNLKGFRCGYHYWEPDDGNNDPYNLPGLSGSSDGDEVGPGPTIPLTLTDSEPLMVLVFGYEADPFGTDKPGSVSKLWLPGDYFLRPATTLDVSLPSQKGGCSNGRCYDTTIEVTILQAPPPPASSSSSVAANIAAHNAMVQANNALTVLNNLSASPSNANPQ